MKTDLSQLALFGGPPAFAAEWMVGRPSTSNAPQIHAAIDAALARNWLTNDGPLVRELETRCAEFLEVPHCVAVNNATIGLQLVAHALELPRHPGGEVLVPSFTFVGTAHALSWLGLKPVFCDVDPHNHGLDPQDAARRITDRTCGILGVHLWGRGCDVDGLDALGRLHGLPVFHDAAHAFGCSHQGQMIGRNGSAEVFSLHATKAMHALEGGLITTTDDALAEQLRLLRNYGFTDEDCVSSLGINAKMNEFSAAVGLANLAGYPALAAHNRALHQAYREALDGCPGLQWVAPQAGERHNHHYAVLQVGADCPLSRDLLRDLLVAEGIYVRRYFRPGCHRFAPYAEAGLHLPVTEALSDQLLQLPTGRQLTPEDANRIGSLIRWFLTQAPRIAARRNMPRT